MSYKSWVEMSYKSWVEMSYDGRGKEFEKWN